MAKKSLRIYLVEHSDGRVTGILMRRWDRLFDVAQPAAYGENEEDVKAQLLSMLRERQLGGSEPLERYLWRERFAVRRVTVDVYPQSMIDKRPVIGARRIPLKLYYAWTRLSGGDGDGDGDGGDSGSGSSSARRRAARDERAEHDEHDGPYKVMLPRFGWWITLESLDNADVALQSAISAALLGETPAWLYDFRPEGSERVEAWMPDILLRDEQPPDDEVRRPVAPAIEAVAEDLVERVARRKIPLPVGESAITSRDLLLLDRNPLPSILLVGGPGVGKSTWVTMLAQKLELRRRDKARRRRGEQVPRIFRTSGDRLIAGMVYLGQWQKRILDIIKALRHEGDFLYVDRLTSILSSQPDGASIAEMLVGPMEAGEVALIAECSEPELERCRQRAPSLLSQFQIIRVQETTPARVPELIAVDLARRAPEMALRPEALKRLVHYLSVFQRHSRFPGKAFRFSSWLATQRAAAPASSVSVSAQRSAGGNGGGESASPRSVSLDTADVSHAFARFSGLPVELIADETLVGRSEIAARLAERVIGQDRACDEVAQTLARFKAGLNDPERPVGSLLFVGPTGVGKTELCKQLARYMFGDAQRLVRVDMSEYLAPGAAQRLLAVGDGQQSLAEWVREQPLSVVLLDEIEKAHAEVFDLLLGVLGEGRLSDSLGRLVDFRMTLIVMTSNLGAGEGRPVGFSEGAASDFVGHVRRFFRPELVGRLDRVVPFRALERADVERIVELELDKVSARAGLRRRALRLRVEPAARSQLAELGFHALYGARPLKRVIEERVVAPLSVKLAADPALREQSLWVLARDSELRARLDPAEQRVAITL
ncbi:MAG: ATP-dependent Clp protease ATP-binding subunit [Myxococcales bacterium]|nr:ATP-dependent Clp protease ATP-binding subunit [Myxococcales bacterium]